MIDRTHALPVVRQCRILALSRSTVYYQPSAVSPDELALMRRIDELHLAHPFAGARMLRRMLTREEQPVGSAPCVHADEADGNPCAVSQAQHQ